MPAEFTKPCATGEGYCFNVECAAQFSYYLVSPSNRAERPAVAAFREWLVAEAKRAEAEYDDG